MTVKNETLSLAAATALVVDAAKTEVAAEKAIAAFKAASVDWAHYKTLRAAYIKARREASGCKADAAAKAWERLCAKAGYKAPKSTSKAATAKAAQRNAAKPSEADKTTVGRIVSPMSAKKAVGAAKFELSGIEAHLVDLFRRGNFKAIIDICHSEAEKKAPV